ncbi:MAG: SEC-C metal-binding domain-containing protein [Gammaproteobacteria bacterium]|nr:SEC-C metal-binding domain-containing protein [Gammaproteobacteria bacterium]
MAEQNIQEFPTYIEEPASSCCSDDSCCGPQTPVTRDAPKIGRNDPCVCGSGRKFKKCCG